MTCIWISNQLVLSCLHTCKANSAACKPRWLSRELLQNELCASGDVTFVSAAYQGTSTLHCKVREHFLRANPTLNPSTAGFFQSESDMIIGTQCGVIYLCYFASRCISVIYHIAPRPAISSTSRKSTSMSFIQFSIFPASTHAIQAIYQAFPF